MTPAERLPFPASPALTAAAVACGWLLISLAAGTAQLISARLSGGGGQGAYVGPMLAGLIWIPITLGAITLAARFPLRLPLRWRPLLVHGLGAALVSLVLNTAYVLIAVGLGWMWVESLTRQILSAALFWAHINAGVYLAIVSLTSLLVHARGRDPGAKASAGDAPDEAPYTTDSGGVPRLRAEAGGKVHLVPLSDVDWIEGAGDYARLHTADREYLCSERLKGLERSLAPHAFVRIHRSIIVNAARIAEMRHVARGDYAVRLMSGTTLRAARRRRQALEQAVDALVVSAD